MLKAGRELDALVAEKVMGFTGLGYYGPPEDGSAWQHGKSVRHDTAKQAQESYRLYWEARHKGQPGYMDPDDQEQFSLCHWEDAWGPLLVHDYSTDIAAAREVVEKLHADHWQLDIELYEGESPCAMFFRKRDSHGPVGTAAASADTVQLAICLAALKAIEKEPS